MGDVLMDETLEWLRAELGELRRLAVVQTTLMARLVDALELQALGATVKLYQEGLVYVPNAGFMETAMNDIVEKITAGGRRS